MARYLTFRFDDGYIAGAEKAAKLLLPYHGSFFIITDWVNDESRPECGDLNAWKLLGQQGNDIQPHSKTHRKLSDLGCGEQYNEIKGSVEFVQNIHDRPYIFCFPYNSPPRPPLAVGNLSACGLSACGFDASQPAATHVNQINDELDVFRLRSWDVDQHNFASIPFHLDKSVPDDAWVVLGLHSLDGEGWEPLTSDQLSCLVCAARGLNYEIVTAAAMIEKLAQRSQ
jgi:peptidoglycan/xylan/chitin deacetylase (PgdA/CDA1 family)